MFESIAFNISSCVIEIFSGFSKTISIFWPDEKMNITWDLKNIQINTKLNKALWKMPNHKNKYIIN